MFNLLLAVPFQLPGGLLRRSGPPGSLGTLWAAEDQKAGPATPEPFCAARRYRRLRRRAPGHRRDRCPADALDGEEGCRCPEGEDSMKREDLLKMLDLSGQEAT